MLKMAAQVDKGLTLLPDSASGEYRCRVSLDFYDSPSCQGLATQAASGRHLQVISEISDAPALQVRLWEDGYVAWLPQEKLAALEPAPFQYRAVSLSRADIQQRLPAVIAFVGAAMQQPNYYLWGGNLGPNYDCSGLIQAAFAASGIWLPRDSYQQEAFAHKIDLKDLLPGDLIFFGSEKVNHVALYLGENCYCHSSGKESGRNGIGIDCLLGKGDEISQFYWQKFWGCGRIMGNYQPN
jgi:cell wall-associated NlpC family hydrolase